MRSPLQRAFVLAIFLVGFGACRPSPIEPPEPAGIPEADPDTVREVEAALSGKAGEVQTFRSLAHVTASRGIGSEELTQVIVFSRPDRLRVEFFEPNLTQLLALIVVADGEVQSVDKQDGVVYRGSATPEVMRRLLSIPFAPDAAMLWFVGRFTPPAQENIARRRLFRLGDGQQLLIYVLRDGRELRVRLRGEDHLVMGVELLSSSREKLLRSDFTYGPGSAAPVLPVSIELELPAQNTVASIVYDNPAVNPPPERITDRLFRFPQISGMKVVELDSLD